MNGPLLTPLWATPPAIAFGLTVIQLAAFAFAWWARIHMGRLWSGSIVVRADHRVIDTGPFRLVRHPIYTAFITASWTLALIGAMPQALAGAGVLTALMVLKSRSEERFLRSQLGEAAYDAYAARTPQLVPLIGWR
jgi:protein-S-isoprenylcysteine O-methyltransferase Ste14